MSAFLLLIKYILDQFTMTDNDNSVPVTLGGQNAEPTNARLTSLETSMADIRQSLQQLLAQNTPQNQPSSSGTAANFNISQSSVVSSVSAPPFLAVTTTASSILQNLCLPSQSLQTSISSNLQQPSVAASSLGVPINVNTQFFLPHVSTPGATVAGVLPPVPGYLVNLINKNLFVDFVLLRPCNIEKLPSTEPMGPQLNKLLKCEKGSELQLVKNFVEWAEAWAVYSGVVCQNDPSKMGNLISYFLLIAKISRDSGGSGWLDYDRAFRKKAAENSSLLWGEIDMNLFVSVVLSKPTKTSPPTAATATPSSSGHNSGRGICYNWNFRECPYRENCKFRHSCMSCFGSHKFKFCNSTKESFEEKSARSSKRERSQSPSPPPPSKRRSK